MSKNEEIGSLNAVSYNKDTDEVFVVFKINDPNYKDYVLRWAKQEAGRFQIRGESLVFTDAETGMRSAGRRD